MLKAEKLVKRFGEKEALSGLDTTIGHGSVYGLVGPNGSGKSTFLRLISGVYRPDGGSLTLGGEEIYDNPKAKDRVFYLADDLYFPPKATTEDLRKFYRGLYSTWSDERYLKIKKAFPIDTEKRLSTFSKGMRRQAALLVALSANTDYLLLDEAFDGLDPVMRLLLKKLLAEQIAERDATVIIASHNLRELEDLCDQVGLLYQGRLLFEKDLDSLKLGVCRVQAAFDTEPDFKAAGLDIMQKKGHGKLLTLTIRGDAETTLNKINALGPRYAEALPLTLEEVFIGEMEAVGYDSKNILL